MPITFGNNWHLGNALPRPGPDLISDLMNGVVFNHGTHYGISPLDPAVPSCVGVPVAFPRGDWNRDDIVTSADISAMLSALTDLNAYKFKHSLNDAQLASIGDFDFDGTVSNRDIQGSISSLAKTALDLDARMNITAQSLVPNTRAKVLSLTPLGWADRPGWV